MNKNNKVQVNSEDLEILYEYIEHRFDKLEELLKILATKRRIDK